jgi:hypothetical protein
MRSIRAVEDGSDRVLAVVVGSQTTVDVALRRPLTLLASRGNGTPFTAVRLFVDDDDAVVTRLREGLREHRPSDAGKRPR